MPIISPVAVSDVEASDSGLRSMEHVEGNHQIEIRGVIANGEYFDRATLDRMDPEGLQLRKGYVER